MQAAGSIPRSGPTKIRSLSAMRTRSTKIRPRANDSKQLKLRDEDFVTITRAESLDHATQLDREIAGAVVKLFRQAWDGKKPIRLLGVHAGSLEHSEGQMNLLEEPNTARLREVFRSVDHIRNKFGDASISLAKTLDSEIRERVHENPFGIRDQKT